MVEGQKLRKLTAVALMKGKFVALMPEIRANWDRVVKTTNGLIINLES